MRLTRLRVILWCLTLDLLCAGLYSLAATDAGRDAGARAPAAAVLWGDDRLAGPETDRRIAHAVTLWQQGRCARVLVVGGYREPGSPSGAAQMRDMLIAGGVPAAAIVTGGNSYDTVSNLAEIVALEPGRGGADVLVVSDRLHVARVRWWIAPRVPGLRLAPAGYPPRAPALPSELFHQLIRVHHEWVATLSLALPEHLRARWLAALRLGNAAAAR